MNYLRISTNYVCNYFTTRYNFILSFCWDFFASLGFPITDILTGCRDTKKTGFHCLSGGFSLTRVDHNLQLMLKSGVWCSTIRCRDSWVDKHVSSITFIISNDQKRVFNCHSGLHLHESRTKCIAGIPVNGRKKQQYKKNRDNK